MELKERWTSSFYFVLAATGAAVGLGSIWKFPYEVGYHGGGLFVLLYLIFIVLIGIPAMIAEMTVGVIGRNDPIHAISAIKNTGHCAWWWQFLGVLSLVTLMCIFSFYSVVAGWAIDYLLWSFQVSFDSLSPGDILKHWESLQASPERLVYLHTAFCMMTASVILFPLQRGLERASKYLMPLLFLVVILLVFVAHSLPGSAKALTYLFEFRVEEFNSTVMLIALGNACFTLASGAGAMLMYGAYLPKKTNVFNVAGTVAILNALVALMSGYAIFSVVFSYNVAADSGPGLMFTTLPLCFKQLAYGQALGIAFFLLLVVAAWTSALSLLEPWVCFLSQKLNCSRPIAALLATLLGWFLGIGTVISLNIGKSWYLVSNLNFYQLIDFISTDIFLNIGLMGYALLIGWGISHQLIKNNFHAPDWIINIWFFMVKYLLPLSFIIMILGIV